MTQRSVAYGVRKIFGPPGTGKTTRLLNLLDDELRSGVDPARIAFLTFTVAARREAIDRIRTRFDLPASATPHFRTLHSLAFRMLRLGRGALVDGKKLAELAEITRLDFTLGWAAHEDALGLWTTHGTKPGDKLLQFDHLRRHRLQSVDDALRFAPQDFDIDIHIVRYFSQAYAEWKRDEGLADFTDLLQRVSSPLDVDVILVDEAQDLSALQWRALDTIAATAQRTYIAGDDDQAIFTWAGADPEQFIRRPGEVEVLGQSYRIPKCVHVVAERVASYIRVRQPKEYRPREEEGEIELLMSFDAWRPGSDDEDTLILYRNHYLGREVARRLEEMGYPYSRQDRGLPDAFRWRDSIVAYERIRQGKNVPDEGHAASRNAMTEHGRSRQKMTMPWYEALDRIDPAEVQYLRSVLARFGVGGLTQPPKIRISTIHAAKGQQADAVVLLTDMSRKSREGLLAGSDDEVRVYYVAVTRAKQRLTLIGADNPLFPPNLPGLQRTAKRLPSPSPRSPERII